MWNKPDDDSERPRPPLVEPEILPPVPGDGNRDRARPDRVWATRQRVFIAPPGLFGVVLGLVALAALVGVAIVAFLGFFLLLVPAVGAFVAVFILATLLRGPRRL